MWEEEERETIPQGGELLPPLEVKHEVLGERDDLVKGGSRGAEVDHPSEEGPPGWDHLGGKAEGADKGELFPLGAAGTAARTLLYFQSQSHPKDRKSCRNNIKSACPLHNMNMSYQMASNHFELNHCTGQLH